MNRTMLVSSCAVAMALVALAFVFPIHVRAEEPPKRTAAAASRTFKVEPMGQDKFPGCIKKKKEEETTVVEKKDKTGTIKKDTTSAVLYECVPGCTYNLYLAEPDAKLRATDDKCSAACEIASISGPRMDVECEKECRASKQCVVQSCTTQEVCAAAGWPCYDKDTCKVIAGSKLDAALEEAGVAGPKPSGSDALTPEQKKLKKIEFLEEQKGVLNDAWEVYKTNKENCKKPPCTAVVPESIVKKLGLYTEGCKDGQCPMKLDRMEAQLKEKQLKLNADIAKTKGGLSQDPTKKKNNTQVPPPNQGPGTQYYSGPSTFSQPTGSRGGGLGNLGSILGAAGKVLSGLFGGQQCPQQQQQAQTCPTDPQAYQRYQQWYQQQIQQYQYRMQMYQQQRQMNAYYGRTTTTCPPQPPVPCRQGGGTGGEQCKTPPPLPNSACAAGWRPVYTGTCLTDWTCGGSTSTGPTAQISCQPKIADVGTTIAISFSCSSGTATGTGFETQDEQSGSATAVIEEPAKGVKTAEFGLTCTDDGRSSSRTCGVRINKPVIVFVSNPKKVAPGETATIGWVTAGMESCVVSSPDFSVFTEENKDKPKTKGAVETPELTKTSTFVLECVTLGGGTKTAEEIVTVE